jgi:hypothetical protein
MVTKGFKGLVSRRYTAEPPLPVDPEFGAMKIIGDEPAIDLRRRPTS